MERIGVNALEASVLKLGWIFREQPISDMGIDAHIEICHHGAPTGRLIAVQIKTGPSYFSEPIDGGFVFRGSKEHLSYWLSHALPVILVLHDPASGKSYWRAISQHTIEETAKAWKTVVPSAVVFGDESRTELESLTEVSAAAQRWHQLAIARGLMEQIAKGNRVLFEASEWVNKCDGRGSLRIIVEESTIAPEAEEEAVEFTDPAESSPDSRAADWMFIWVGLTPYRDIFRQMFPWATFTPDEEYYEDADEEEYYAQEGHWDSDEGHYIEDPEGLAEYREGLSDIRPYDVESNEVAHYRLELGLNEIGRAFLTLDEYLKSGASSSIT